jgi:hypothetical protein
VDIWIVWKFPRRTDNDRKSTGEGILIRKVGAEERRAKKSSPHSRSCSGVAAVIGGARKISDRIFPHPSHYSLKGITGNRNFEKYRYKKLAPLPERRSE